MSSFSVSFEGMTVLEVKASGVQRRGTNKRGTLVLVGHTADFISWKGEVAVHWHPGCLKDPEETNTVTWIKPGVMLTDRR